MATRVQLVAGEEVFLMGPPPQKKPDKKKKEPKKTGQSSSGVGSKRIRTRAFDYLDYAVMLSEPDRDLDIEMYDGSRETDRLNRERERQMKQYLIEYAKRDRETEKIQKANARAMDTEFDPDDLMTLPEPEPDPEEMDGMTFENEQEPVEMEDESAAKPRTKRTMSQLVDEPPDEINSKRPIRKSTVTTSTPRSQTSDLATDSTDTLSTVEPSPAEPPTNDAQAKPAPTDKYLQAMADMMDNVKKLMENVTSSMDIVVVNALKRDQQISQGFEEVRKQQTEQLALIQSQQNDVLIDAMEGMRQTMSEISNTIAAGNETRENQSRELVLAQTEQFVKSINSLQAQLGENARGVHASQQQQLEQMQQFMTQMFHALANTPQPQITHQTAVFQTFQQLQQNQLSQQLTYNQNNQLNHLTYQNNNNNLNQSLTLNGSIPQPIAGGPVGELPPIPSSTAIVPSTAAQAPAGPVHNHPRVGKRLRIEGGPSTSSTPSSNSMAMVVAAPPDQWVRPIQPHNP